MDFKYWDDIELVRHLRKLSYADLAKGCGLSEKTLVRWAKGESKPSAANLSAFYDYAFDLGVPLNRIKGDLYREQLDAQEKVALFHGSRTSIEGEVDLARCNPRSDFGRGFYCGESMEQSALFVSSYPRSSLYIVSFDPIGLRGARFAVDQEWMLAVAYFRGRLDEYADHPCVRAIARRVEEADYVIAPIADNRMYEIISEFIDGITTDVVCQHCLSATQLGSQYVFRTPKALANVELLERCFLPQGERRLFERRRRDDLAVAEDKVKAAKRLYRKDGRFIDEVLQ